MNQIPTAFLEKTMSKFFDSKKWIGDRCSHIKQYICEYHPATADGLLQWDLQVILVLHISLVELNFCKRFIVESTGAVTTYGTQLKYSRKWHNSGVRQRWSPTLHVLIFLALTFLGFKPKTHCEQIMYSNQGFGVWVTTAPKCLRASNFVCNGFSFLLFHVAVNATAVCIYACVFYHCGHRWVWCSLLPNLWKWIHIL